MPSLEKDTKLVPPRLIPSLVEGFNTVASNIYLILFPAFLDLLLWFGPRVSVKKFFLPLLMDATEVASPAYGDQGLAFIETSKEIWSAMLEQFNLLFALRTFPIGVPSLMISLGAVENPLGRPMQVDLTNGQTIIFWLTAILFIGLIFGSIYFSLTANLVRGGGFGLQIKGVIGQTIQGLVLSLLLTLAISLITIPVSCLLSSILLVLPSLGYMPAVFISMLGIWLLLPIAFSAHGIFNDDLPAGKAILVSWRLVRTLMTPTGMLFIIIILLGSGLDVLWATPAENSWMLLVGIFGHAFISSGLLAASFVFYNDGVRWLMSTIKPKKKKEKPSVVS